MELEIQKGAREVRIQRNKGTLWELCRIPATNIFQPVCRSNEISRKDNSRRVLGYEMLPGGDWKQHYKDVPLLAFDDMPLKYDTKGYRQTFKGRVVITEDVHTIPGTRSWFPLRERSVYANHTLDGRAAHRRLQEHLISPRPPSQQGKSSSGASDSDRPPASGPDARPLVAAGTHQKW